MKNCIKILLILLVMTSCQNNKKEDHNSLGSRVENRETSKNKSSETFKDSQTKTTLTEAQFKDFFPKEIGDYKLLEPVSVLMSSAVAGATYVKGDDYGHALTYNLEDCNRKGAANVRNFEDGYKRQGQGAPGTAYVYRERDGHKTIAFIQPKINHASVRFIYNNRFRLVLSGFEDGDVLWSYFDFENIKKLDQTN